MQIVFAGVLIASDPLNGGTDCILGFQMPKASRNIEVAEFLDAEDAVIFDRGNRKRTMTGTVTRASVTGGDAIADAFAARMEFFDSLPGIGSLVITEGDRIATFANAGLRTPEEGPDVAGVSWSFTLVFDVGPVVISAIPPTPDTHALQDPSGAPLQDPSGNQLETP